jgi:hypothetical protein
MLLPNRVIKESIRTSKSVNSMTDLQFRLWTYLITYVDDYGRGSADPEILKGFVFPRRKGMTEQTIAKTLAELATAGSIILYQVDGESYLCFPNWERHQTIRNKRSKFPEPPDIVGDCEHLQTNENKCLRNPIQSESISESESESECTAPDEADAVLSLPLNDGTDYPVYESDIAEWEALYPAVDISQELRNMRGWCLDNPKKRKTKAGIRRFIGGWLAREQNRGGNRSRGRPQSAGNGFAELVLSGDLPDEKMEGW